MSDNDKKQPSLYVIPQNFAEHGVVTILGMPMKTRNLLEAAVIFLAIGFPIYKTGLSMMVKLWLIAIFALTPAIIAVFGIQGTSLTQFVTMFIRFFKRKRVVRNTFEDKQEKAEEIRENSDEFTKEAEYAMTDEADEDVELTAEEKPKSKLEQMFPGLALMKQSAASGVSGGMSAFLPIKDIKNGIIYTNDGRYIKILEVTPVNLDMMSPREQENVILNFMAYLKIARSKLQFKVLTKKADISSHIKVINEEFALEKNERVKEMQLDYAQLIQQVGMLDAVSHRFFFIFEYEGMPNRKNTEEAAVAQLMQDVNTATTYLRECGNEIVRYENDNDFIICLLYEMFNRGQFSKSFEEKLAGFETDQLTKEDINFRLNDIIAPDSIDITNPKYTIIDGVYHAHLLVASNGYVPKVPAGWLSLLVNAGDGIDLDVFANRQDAAQVFPRLARNMAANKANLNSAKDTDFESDTLAGAVQSGYYIKEAMADGFDFYYVNIMITITAQSLEALEEKVSNMEQLLTSRSMKVISCKFREEQALISSLPLNQLSKDLYDLSKRNVMTDGLASCYPFISYELCDPTGILLGTSTQNSSMCILDLFNSKRYPNANMAIIGTSGSGKTFTSNLIAMRMRRKGIQVFIISPARGMEDYYRACKQIGGEFIQITPASNHCINIMEIRKTDDSAFEALGMNDAVKSRLAAKIESLNIFFSLLIPDMSGTEKQLLENAIIETYRRKGIGYDNASLVDPESPDRYREMPIIGDLYNVLKESEDTRRVSIIIDHFVNGSARSFNHQTNVDLSNPYTVLDISELKGDMVVIGMYIALDYVWDKTKENRLKKKAIFIDETWKLIGASSNSLAANFVLEIFKIIRGYGGSAICATQNIDDFFALDGGKYGKGIIGNASVKLCMKIGNEDEAEAVQKSFRLTDSEVSAVTNLQRGYGIVISGSNHVPVHFIASDLEKNAITTDRSELEKIAAQSSESA